MRIYRRHYRSSSGEKRTGLAWWVRFTVGGKQYNQSLKTHDRRTAELLALDVVKKAELRAAGLRDRYDDHREAPIDEHLWDFEKTLVDRKVVRKYLNDRMGCLGEYLDACKIRTIADMDLDRASWWLSELRSSGLSARSVNRRYQALNQFGLWLVKTDRAPRNPFRSLQPHNEDEDRRHVRRALTPEEAFRLIAAAQARPMETAQKRRVRSGVSPREAERLTRLGQIRALTYAIALETGMRRAQIRKLRWAHADLERMLLTAPVTSARAPRRRKIGVSPELVIRLHQYRPEGVMRHDLIVPAGHFPSIATFHRDLHAAGIARRDRRGRVVDFQALTYGMRARSDTTWH